MSAIISNEPPLITRERVVTFTLLAATLICFYLCYKILYPFFPALTWALALAVVLHPIHDWFSNRIKNRDLAAGLAVATVAVVIVVPSFFVIDRLLTELIAGLSMINQLIISGQWRNVLTQNPKILESINWISSHINIQGDLSSIAGTISSRLSSTLVNSVMVIVELLITLFILFFFFRDSKQMLISACSLTPLTENESLGMFKKINDTILATIYGTIIVAIVQGTLGGLIFWLLGLPAPLLWGVIMGMLAIVPVLGSFVVWVPAAVFLALQGSYSKAIILATWGIVVIGFIDNLLYPLLVGKRLRLGTLPVFFAMIGGLTVFGSAGVILGPVVFVITSALIEIWRKRAGTKQTDAKMAA